MDQLAQLHQPIDNLDGTKGLLFIGEKILVYRRDGNTGHQPYHLDLPGGGAEPSETPYQTFEREVREEFSLAITPNDIYFAKSMPAIGKPDEVFVFVVARLPKEHEYLIHLGNEGTQWHLVSLSEYLGYREVAWPLLQQLARDYAREAGLYVTPTIE